MTKNCLLCGKPFSRIRAGGGEDFCSREHRNQYRLRQGMDRLTEANKVASVMRRRENPRPLGFVPVSNDPAPRTPEIATRIQTAPRRTVMRPSLPKLETRLPNMGDMHQAILYPTSRVEHSRAFALLRWRVDRLGRPGMIPTLQLPPTAAVLLHRAGEVRTASPRAQKGRALRVSLAAGFPMPKPRAHKLPASEPFLRGRLTWNDAPRRATVRNSPARPRLLRPRTTTVGPISEVTGPAFHSGIDKPGVLAGKGVMHVARPAMRLESAPLQFPVPAATRNRTPNFQPLEIRRAPGASDVAVTIARPVAVPASHRITSVSFAPQDSYATTFVQEQEPK